MKKTIIINIIIINDIKQKILNEMINLGYEKEMLGVYISGHPLDKIKDLKDSLDYWKDKFQRVVKFIHDKIHGIFGDKDDKYKDQLNGYKKYISGKTDLPIYLYLYSIINETLERI